MMNKAILKQAQKMQQQLAKIQEELESATVEASAGGGAVTAVVSGQQKLLSIRISPEAVDAEDIGLLEDMVQAAVNEALEKAKAMAAQRLSAVTGGLSIPGLL